MTNCQNWTIRLVTVNAFRSDDDGLIDFDEMTPTTTESFQEEEEIISFEGIRAEKQEIIDLLEKTLSHENSKFIILDFTKLYGDYDIPFFAVKRDTVKHITVVLKQPSSKKKESQIINEVEKIIKKEKTN